MAKSQGSLGVKAGAKGKGSASKREEKRKAKFAPKTLGGAKANVLSDPSDTPPAAKKRPREESVPVAAGSKKPYKQGAFARAAPPPRAAPEEPQQPLSKKEMKSLVEARKSASKPNFALIQELTVSWEKLRRLNIPEAERARLTTEVAAKVKGRATKLASSHKASRVLQSILKHGTPAQAAALAAELAPEAAALAKDAYGSHLVLRMVESVDKADGLPRLAQAMRPHAPRLAKHPFAAPVLDALYARLAPPQRTALLADFYGPAVALARNAARAAGRPASGVTLRAVLDAQSSAAGRTAVLQRLGSHLTPILEKGLVSFSFVHRLLAEYLSTCGAQGVSDAALSVAGPALLRMIHTPDGARCASRLLAASSARERKALLKALKGRVPDVARDACGHLALLACLECVDDTALLGKSILGELKEVGKDGSGGLAAIAQHKTARRLLLLLLAHRSPRYLPPDVLSVLPPLVQAKAGAAAGDAGDEDDEEEEGDSDDDDDEHGVGSGAPGAEPTATSKKPSALRRQQLLSQLAAPLLAACTAAVPLLLRHPFGCDVLFESARGWGGDEGPLAGAAPAAAAAAAALRAAVVAAAAAEVVETPEEEEEEGEGDEANRKLLSELARSSFYATRTLRRLALESSAFAGALWNGALKGRVPAWAAGHGAKVLAAVVVAGDAPTRKAAAAEMAAAGLLAKGKKAEEWAAAFAGTEAGEDLAEE